MSNTVWSKKPDDEFKTWQTQFFAACSDFSAELDLNVTELAEIEGVTDELQEAMRELVEARAAYEAAVVRKDLARAKATGVDRRYVARFQADSDISIEVFSMLNVPLRNRRGARGRAKPVGGVTASADANGIATIKFNRAENPESALFLIQERKEHGDWKTVTCTKRTRIKLKGYPPGEPVIFRVITLRNETQAVSKAYGSIWAAHEKPKPAAAA